ncbi:MAG: hypothetical protein QOG24_05850 [Nitrososphaeraceae archaeon]|nr:hypothetical protein [Nitrososphaeraceae archaeon]
MVDSSQKPSDFIGARSIKFNWNYTWMFRLGLSSLHGPLFPTDMENRAWLSYCSQILNSNFENHLV